MDPWEQKLDNTQIITRMRSLDEKLATYDESALSVDDRSYLDRMKAVNEQLHIILENIDPEVVNLSAANTIATSLANITSYLDNWTSSGNSTYLNNHLFNETNSIIQSISSLAPAVSLPEARAAIVNLRRSAGQQKRIVETITQEIKAKGSLADTTIDEKVTETQKLLETIGENAEGVNDQLQETQTSINKLATDQTAAFNTAETERAKEFTKLMSMKQDQLDATLDDLAQKTSHETGVIKKIAEKDAQATEDAKVRAEKLLGIVSQDALISDYSKNAKREWLSSLIWQIVAATSILLAIIFASTLANEATSDMAWQKLAARLAVVTAFGGLATYAAKQASEHRHAQRQSEHMSLQLSAVRPYLEDVTDKLQRDALLVKLADKFFSEKKSTSKAKKETKDKGEEFLSANDLLNFIATLVKRP